MKFLVLAMLLASAIAAPQFPVNSQGPIQAILLPSASSISQNQQSIPAGAQVIYLQSQPQQISYIQGQGNPQGQIAFLQGGAQQGQFSFVQGQPQGQVIYLQSAPQQFSTFQTGPPQYSSFTSTSTSSQQQPSFSTTPQQSSSSSYTNSQSSQSSQSSFSPPRNSFTAPKPQPYKPVNKPAPYRPQPPTPSYSKPSQSYAGSPSPGTPGTPGEGGVYGYVTIRQSQDDDFDGNFRYNYETDHGIVVDAVGSVKNPGTEDQIQVIQGSYSYKNPDGTVITTTYTADENGFVAQGDHLPKEGPLPEAIAKALAYIASQPSTDE